MISVNSWIRTPPKAEDIKEHYNKEKQKYFYSFIYVEREDKGNNNFVYNSYLIYVCTNTNNKPLPNQLLSVDSISGVGLNSYTSKKNGKTYYSVVMFICAKEVNVKKNNDVKGKYKNYKNNNGANNNYRNKINGDYSSSEISSELDDIPI